MKNIRKHIKTVMGDTYRSHLIFNDRLKNGDRSIKVWGAKRETHEKIAKHLNTVGYQAEVRSVKSMIPAHFNSNEKPRFNITSRIVVKNKTE